VTATAAEPDGTRLTVLHIGTMKSGTSYLQDVLALNRDALKADGIHYLGRGTRAVWDVLGLGPDTPQAADKTVGKWEQLVSSARQSREPVRLLSMELLSLASEDGARTVVDSFDSDRIEIVITARDMSRVIPSAWQNAVKHGRKMSFPAFAESVSGINKDRSTRANFWKQHDLVEIVKRWAAVVGEENIHLVTVPPPAAPPELLWSRFCEVLHIDPAAYDTRQGKDSNFSLSYSDTELVRRLNRRGAADFRQENFDRYILKFLANEVMRPPSKSDPTDVASLDAASLAWARRQGATTAEELRQLRIHVAGDLDDLIPGEPAGSAGGVPAEHADAERDGPADGSEPLVVYPDTAVRAIFMLLRKLMEIDPKAVPEPKRTGQPQGGQPQGGRSQGGRSQGGRSRGGGGQSEGERSRDGRSRTRLAEPTPPRAGA